MLQKHRILTLSIILAFVVVVAIGGWLLGAQIQSPAEAAARTAPPVPSPILVPAERRVLTSDIVTRGTARYGLPQTLSLVPSTLKGTGAILTTLPERGLQVQEGDLLLTASERPAFVLLGETPVYRDLTFGLTGKDVQQLEAALQRMGHDPGVVDGTFDEETAAAVSAWYRASGWQPAAPSPAYQAELRQLQGALAQAEERLLTAEDAAALAPLHVDVARANGEQANQTAAALVAEKQAQSDQLAASDNVSQSARVAAEADVTAAQAAAVATALEGDVALQTAISAQSRTARAVTAAQAEVDRLAAEVAAATQRGNGYLPADELIFVPALPVRVQALEAAVGDPARGAVVTVTNNQLAVDSQLPLAEAPLVKPGMAVAIDEPDLGVQATGTIARVAESPGTDGVDGYHLYFETTVDESTTEIDGFSVRLTIPVASTDGAVTVVPISALSLRADGRSVIQVDHAGTLREVVVTPGLSADGFVEVTMTDEQLTPGQLVVIGYTTQEVQ